MNYSWDIISVAKLAVGSKYMYVKCRRDFLLLISASDGSQGLATMEPYKQLDTLKVWYIFATNFNTDKYAFVNRQQALKAF